MQFAGQKVICVVGLSGVGKSTAIAILHDQGSFEIVHFGGVVLNEVTRLGLELTPGNERIVRETLRQAEGMAVMAKRSLEEIDKILAREHNVLVDGLYSNAEYELLSSRYPSQVLLIAIHARKSVRAKRLVNREHRPLTFIEMAERDRAEIAKLDKATPITIADYHIVNDTTAMYLKMQLKECLQALFTETCS